MNIIQKNKHLFIFVLFFLCGFAYGKDNCFGGESVVISFLTKSGNQMSICMGVDEKYLVYRYGNDDSYFQFPKKLDHRSWGEFSYSWMRRPGGKINAGFGDYTLSFVNFDFEYSVFQKWDDEESNYEIGILVRNLKNKRTTKIIGLSDSQKGSLVLLENNKNIQNTAFEQ